MNTIVIIAITAMAIILVATGIHSAEALKVVVQFKYSDWQKKHFTVHLNSNAIDDR